MKQESDKKQVARKRKTEEERRSRRRMTNEKLRRRRSKKNCHSPKGCNAEMAGSAKLTRIPKQKATSSTYRSENCFGSSLPINSPRGRNAKRSPSNIHLAGFFSIISYNLRRPSKNRARPITNINWPPAISSPRPMRCWNMTKKNTKANPAIGATARSCSLSFSKA